MIQVKFYHTNNNWLANNGYSEEEQATLYEKQLQDIIDNPRYYLDNFDKMHEYRVSWGNYTRDNVTVPYRFREETKDI